MRCAARYSISGCKTNNCLTFDLEVLQIWKMWCISVLHVWIVVLCCTEERCYTGTSTEECTTGVDSVTRELLQAENGTRNGCTMCALHVMAKQICVDLMTAIFIFDAVTPCWTWAGQLGKLAIVPIPVTILTYPDSSMLGKKKGLRLETYESFSPYKPKLFPAGNVWYCGPVSLPLEVQ